MRSAGISVCLFSTLAIDLQTQSAEEELPASMEGAIVEPEGFPIVGKRNLPTAGEEALVVSEATAVADEEAAAPDGEGLAAPIAEKSTVAVEEAVLVAEVKRKCPQLRWRNQSRLKRSSLHQPRWKHQLRAGCWFSWFLFERQHASLFFLAYSLFSCILTVFLHTHCFPAYSLFSCILSRSRVC
jgi:hypothetical protein